MKENVLDILMYLLENFMCGEIDDTADQASLKAELLRAGFPDQEIEKAFSWLEGLAAMRENSPALPVTAHHALRVYTPDENKRLDAECRGFLMFLEQIGVLQGIVARQEDDHGRDLLLRIRAAAHGAARGGAGRPP